MTHSNLNVKYLFIKYIIEESLYNQNILKQYKGII